MAIEAGSGERTRKRISLVERFNLGARIIKYIEKGTSYEQMEVLFRGEGFPIGYKAIHRWAAKRQEDARSVVADIVREHVERVVPADLTALEEMEVQCLEVSRELKGDFSHKLAAKNITEDLQKWVFMLKNAEEALAENKAVAVKSVVKAIMEQAIEYVSNELNLEKMRESARRTIVQLIDLKLKYSGIIGGAREGGVYFVDAEGGEELGEHEDGGLFIVKPAKQIEGIIE